MISMLSIGWDFGYYLIEDFFLLKHIFFGKGLLLDLIIVDGLDFCA
jgi:hypothetical protein